MLSLVLYLNRTARPRVFEVAPNPETRKNRMTISTALPRCPQLCIIHIEGSIFFGAVDHVGRALHMMDWRNPEQKHALILGSGINFVDAAGGELLASEAVRHRENGGGFYMCNVKSGVTEPLVRGGYMATIGEENIFESKNQAIGEIFKRLDNNICESCTARIFNECATVAPVTD
ncbi:MAG: sodium-independent anion transporter, partial [Gammaproteobacteria bacterium]